MTAKNFLRGSFLRCSVTFLLVRDVDVGLNEGEMKRQRDFDASHTLDALKFAGKVHLSSLP